MLVQRRAFIQTCLVTPLVAATSQAEVITQPTDSSIESDPQSMYGIIGKLEATEGNRDKLIKILLDGTQNMPGCQSYLIAKDNEEEAAIWITEVWETEAHHKASLQLPAVQKAMTEGKPLIAGVGQRHVVTPVG